MLRTPYLAGSPVTGFHGAFEADYGDPSTPEPYAVVAPSRVGGAVLPFRCPSCGAVVDFTTPARREQYHDARRDAPGGPRDNYWCPACGARFRLDFAMPQGGDVVVGEDGVAPYAVSRALPGGGRIVSRGGDRPGAIARVLRSYLVGTDVLGAD